MMGGEKFRTPYKEGWDAQLYFADRDRARGRHCRSDLLRPQVTLASIVTVSWLQKKKKKPRQ